MSAATKNVANDLKAAKNAGQRLVLVAGSDVKLEPVRWAWRGYLPLAMLTLLAGLPGTGKTTLAMMLAAIITRGSTWPDGSPCDHPGDVLIWSGEDPATILAARLAASGADMTRVYFIEGVRENDKIIGFDPARHMGDVRDAALRLPAVRLLVLDPIISAVAGDSHKAAETRRGLQPIVDLAEVLGCAVVGITHVGKSTQGRNPIDRVIGSISFVAIARVVLLASKSVRAEEGAEPVRLLVRAKSNCGPDDGGMTYDLARKIVASDVEGQHVVWGSPIVGSARDLLADAEGDADDDGNTNSDVDSFLRDILADGAKAAKVVLTDGRGAGHATRTIQRAATRLKVVRLKDGVKGGWMWAMPSPAQRGRRHEGAVDAIDTVVASSAPSAPSAADAPVDDAAVIEVDDGRG